MQLFTRFFSGLALVALLCGCGGKRSPSFSKVDWTAIEAKRAEWTGAALGVPSGEVLVFAAQSNVERANQFVNALRSKGWQAELAPVAEVEDGMGIPSLALAANDVRERLRAEPVAVVSLIGSAPFAEHFRRLPRGSGPSLVVADEWSGGGEETREGVKAGWIAAAIVPRETPAASSPGGATEWFEQQFELISRR